MNYQELKKHIGHRIVCVGYALKNLETGKRESDYQNIAIECEDCNEVLCSFDKPQKTNGLKVIANINIEISTSGKNEKKAIEEAENYELPSEYVEDSFEIVKFIDKKGNEFN